VFAELGYPVKFNFTSIFPPDGGDLSLLPDGFNCGKDKDQLWVGIAPFAAHQGKIYPPQLMKQVIVMLTERHPDIRVFLFGAGKGECETLREWERDFSQCTYASGRLSGIGEELILMSHLDVMLSMDSSNMHLASITGVPVVSVWGATHPYAGFTGWRQNPDDAVQIDLPCRPCSIYGNKPCVRGGYPCLKNIPPEQILERIEVVLRRRCQDL